MDKKAAWEKVVRGATRQKVALVKMCLHLCFPFPDSGALRRDGLWGAPQKMVAAAGKVNAAGTKNRPRQPIV